MPCVVPVASAEALIDVIWAQFSEYVAPTLKQGLRKWKRSYTQKWKKENTCSLAQIFYFILLRKTKHKNILIGHPMEK